MGDQLSVINILLKNNSPINTLDVKGKTPLRTAVKAECHLDVIELLLSSGARIEVPIGDDSLLEYVLNQYLKKKCEYTLNSFKKIVQHYRLENPNFKISSLTGREGIVISETELNY